MIIWDEYQYGKSIYDTGSVKTKKWQTNELRSLIKFMLSENSKIELYKVRKKIEECCTDEIKYLTSKQKNNIFNKLISQCKDAEKNVKIIKDKEIVIYTEEIEKIKLLNDNNKEKIVFTLLVYCKWLGLEWLSISKSDLQKESKTTNINSKIFQELLTSLFKDKYLESDVIKLDKLERRKEKIMKKQMWKICCLQNEGEIAFKFNNYINFVFRYLNYVYGGYYECEICGVIYLQNKQNNIAKCNQCKQYKTIDTKEIKCIDCGENVNIDAKDNETCRCEKHREEHIREVNRLRKQKQREKQKLSRSQLES